MAKFRLIPIVLLILTIAAVTVAAMRSCHAPPQTGEQAPAPPVIADNITDAATPEPEAVASEPAPSPEPVIAEPEPVKPAPKPVVKPKPSPKPTISASVSEPAPEYVESEKPVHADTPPPVEEKASAETPPAQEFVDEDNVPAVEGAIFRRWLIGLSGGALFNSSGYEGQDFSSYTSFFGDAAVQYYFTDYLGAGVNIMYRQGKSDTLGNFLGTGEDATFSSGTVALGLSVIGRYPGRTFEPYISGGLTFNFNNIEIKTPNHGYYSGSGSCAGFMADLGLRMYPGEHFFVGVAGRYLHNNQDGVDLGGPGVYLTIGFVFD